MPIYIDGNSWKDLIKSKKVIFDSDALITILDKQANDLIKIFEELKVLKCIIEPVKIELNATNNKLMQVERQDFILKNRFSSLPFPQKQAEFFKFINSVQLFLSDKKHSISVVDLFLIGYLHTYSDSVLLTGNIQDFKFSIFKRIGIIVVQNNDGAKVLYLLTLNKAQLDKYQKTTLGLISRFLHK